MEVTSSHMSDTLSVLEFDVGSLCFYGGTWSFSGCKNNTLPGKGLAMKRLLPLESSQKCSRGPQGAPSGFSDDQWLLTLHLKFSFHRGLGLRLCVGTMASLSMTL